MPAVYPTGCPLELRFRDNALTDTITVEHIGSSDTLTASCPTTEGLGIECSVVLSRAGALPTNGVGEVDYAEDASLQIASDHFRGILGFPLSGNVNLEFESLADGVELSCTAAFGVSCGAFETGAVQTIGTFGWTIGGNDTVQFQSDIDT